MPNLTNISTAASLNDVMNVLFSESFSVNDRKIYQIENTFYRIYKWECEASICHSIHKYKLSPNTTKEMSGSHINKERETHYSANFTKKERDTIHSFSNDVCTLNGSYASYINFKRNVPTT